MNEAQATATTLQLWGAGAFGAIIGWYIYYINRHRQEDVSFTDLVTLIGIIGGTAILKIFPQGSELFGAYGIGLAAGFFGYFFILIVLVAASRGDFNSTFFLDGRRKKLKEDWYIPTRTEQGELVHAAMAAKPKKTDGEPGV